MSMPLSNWQALQQSADRARLAANHEQAIDLYTQALARPDVPWEAFAAMSLARADCREWLGEISAMDAELTALAERAAQRGDNATQAEALGRLLTVRTAELKTSNLRLEQRTAELTIINRVQEGLVRQLDFQAIIDLVGDELMRVFPPPQEKARLYSVFIALYDSQTNLIQFPYWADTVGDRFHQPPIELGEGLTSRVIQSRQPLVLRNWNDAQSHGAVVFDDGLPDEFAQSWLGVPILIGERVTGVICVQDPREGLYTEADMRLLSTLAASLGVALENARLFEETRRLFQAQQERVAELQIINSIQQGLAAELDFQAIVDLVGDKLREVLHTPDLQISWYDEKANLGYGLYLYEHGQRLTFPPHPPRPGGILDRLLKTRQPVVWNTAEEGNAISPVDPGTDESQSGVSVPIISSDRVLGNIQLENYEREYAYGEAELRLLTTIAASLGTALENARLFEETQRLLKETEERNAELAVINSVQAALAAELNIQGIYDTVGDKIREIFHNTDISIRIYDPKTSLEYYPYAYENGQRLVIEPYPVLEKGFSAYIYRTRETLVINENMAQAIEEYGAYLIPGTQAEKSAVYVPLIVGDQARGMVSLSNLEREHAFSDSDVRLLQTLANSMSVALENARLFDETQRLFKAEQERVAELQIINSIQQGLAAELDFQAIVDLVGDKLREVFKTPDLQIAWYDEKTNLGHPLYVYEHGQRLNIPPQPSHPGGIRDRLFKTRQPVIWNTAEEGNAISPVIPGTDESQSGVSVPIISSDRVLGAIQLENYERENAYGEAELRLLTTIAASLGTALENARLFEETQRLLKETEERNAELAVINSVQAALAAELNIQGIYDTVGDKIREIFHNTDISIRIYDAKINLEHFPYVYENGERIRLPSVPLLDFETGIGAYVYRTRQTLVINEAMAQAMEKYGSYLMPGTQAEKSAVFVPLIVGDQARGLVSLSNMEREHAFSDSDVRLLQTLANSMSVALENARLFDETQRLLAETEQRNRELAIISRVGQALAGELDPQGIYELVGEELRQVFDAQVVAIITYDRQENLAHWRYSIEKGQRQSVAPHPPGGFSGHILHTREPLLITHDVDQRAKEYGSTILAGEAPKSYLGVPLIAGGEVTGVITLQNIDREEAFNENDLRLLSTLALSMGVALENARLYQETQHHAVEMAALAEIGSDIASTHEMEPVLERMAAKTRELMQVRDIAMYLLQPDGHTLKPIVSQGKYAEETKAHMISLGKGITGDIAQNGVAEIVNYPERDPRAVHIEGTAPDEEEQECIMLAPLISRGRVIGVMSVYRDRDQGLFNQLELDFLVSLARQAAIAIESARLYAETERRATEMAALAEVSREISATLELPAVLERIVEQARELLTAGTSAVYMLQPDGITLKAIAAQGEVAQEVLADESQLGQGMIGSIVQNGVAESIDNTNLDPRGVHISGTSETPDGEKLLVAPLLVQDRAIGALAVWRDPQDPPFNQAELAFSIGLAQQAAVAIENARLFEAAQETRRRMADIIDFLPDATLVVDREGKVIAWNRAIEVMTGMKAADMLGKDNYEYSLPFYGERRPILIDLVLLQYEEMEKRYANVKRHEDVLEGEAVVPLLRGEPAYLYATASVLRNAKGEVVGAIETIRDISDRKKAEQELHQAKADAEEARQQAEAANQAKSAFLAMMSHEIRTPMNAIIGMSGLLMDTSLNPDQREFAETIRSSGDALLTIINDILDFSKIEAGKMTLEEQPFDLRECIEASLDLMKVRASEKGLELAYQMDPGVPPALLGDVTRLRQVLINLLANAVKFTEQGEIVLTVDNGQEPGSLHFSVRDTGIGIPPDRISQLFRPFTQADASTSRRYGGTGLGLALSKRLTDLMGGSMWVESQGVPGMGSTFHFAISAQPVADWKGRPLLQGEQPLLRGRRLLVVDDHATNRRILGLQAQSWGMQSQEAASAGEALEVLSRSDTFDLAILDMQMPDMDGVELASEIRKLEAVHPGAKRLPLVLFTSLGGRETARGSAEFAAILSKPLRQSALFDVLMAIFAGQAGLAGQPAPERVTLDAGMASRHPLRILLAEDNVVNQKLALRLLSKMGYRADVAGNGLEVIEAVERQPYDVILMDVQMPEMDGLEATRRLCAQLDATHRPRIIAMTANAMQGDREMCLAAGMDDYLSKPIRVEELVKALSRAQAMASPLDV